MDADDLILHDREAKQWLDDIDSFRRPPPVKRLIETNEELATTNVNRIAVENGGQNYVSSAKGGSVGGHEQETAPPPPPQSPDEDFMCKLRKFQLSDCHPYSGSDRVEACKKSATISTGRLPSYTVLPTTGSSGMLSLAISAEARKKQVISKQEAQALRDKIAKLCRPVNPYSSPPPPPPAAHSGYYSDIVDRTSSPDHPSSTATQSSCCDNNNESWPRQSSVTLIDNCVSHSRRQHDDTIGGRMQSSGPAVQPAAAKTSAVLGQGKQTPSSNTGGYNTVMADREVRRILGWKKRDDAFRADQLLTTGHSTSPPHCANNNATSAGDASCTMASSNGHQHRTLKLAQDNLHDGGGTAATLQQRFSTSSSSNSSLHQDRPVSLDDTHQPTNKYSTKSSSTTVYGKEALRYQQLKYEAIKRQVEEEMARDSTVYGDCATCRAPVSRLTDGYHALGSLYHPECFACCCCGCSLCNKKFYHFNGRIYCEQDYMYTGYQEAAEKCHRCGHMVLDMIVQAAGKSFHPSCFCCQVCNVCLDGVPFTVDSRGQFYCVLDYHKLFAPKCAKCNLPITPVSGTVQTVRVVAMDRDYHVDCYVCEGCAMPLTDEPDKRCYPLGDHLLCKSCHLYWSRTGGTQNPITDV